MNENHKELISIALTVAIVTFSIFIIHRFIPSLIWAGVIAIATYPLYRSWQRMFGRYHNVAAVLFTSIMVLLFIVPLSWLISVLVKDLQQFLNYLQDINRHGGQAPSFLTEIPWVGQEIITYWDDNFGQPGHLKHFLSNLHLPLTSASHYLKRIGVSVAHRSVQVGFTLMILFFFYRDGEKLFTQINHVGSYCLGERWFRYAKRLPTALRATVNGTILVGMGVGVLMGGCYALVGFSTPTLAGFLTGFAAMIPFFAPIIFCVVALILLVSGSLLAAIIVVVWGAVILFIADHFVKPVLIGGAIQLPFLAVLFGILGGIETLGFLGLFVGPIILVLFMTLWSEPSAVIKETKNESLLDN